VALRCERFKYDAGSEDDSSNLSTAGSQLLVLPSMSISFGLDEVRKGSGVSAVCRTEERCKIRRSPLKLSRELDLICWKCYPNREELATMRWSGPSI